MTRFLAPSLALIACCACSTGGTESTATPGESLASTPPLIASTAPVVTSSTTPTATQGSDAGATPTMTFPTVPTDTRTGTELNKPFAVNGVVVVSKEHRVSSRYVPAWANETDGLKPEVYAAFQKLAKAARADGLTLTIRSGYRSYAVQKASFQRALATYDEATARRYFAEPGASEHQTGLSLDAWDGVHRGEAFTATAQAAWLAEHAWEYGFIIRYPEGKTDITGYAYESWHLRFVGTEISGDFGPDSDLTLEEYLGLA